MTYYEIMLLEGDIGEVKEPVALSQDDKASAKILTCCCSPQTDILIDAEDLSVLHGIEIKNLPARISHLKLLSADIVEVKLRIPPTASLEFIEGQVVRMK
ncbi:MAG: hypothetical protein HRU06_12785 [Oceanospirillaceae bacterium]|nr:hypothetical protein [Colwellia sp.]NQZ32143.1 hypothetical protein [Oceanospirillaceae bacterium]